MATPNTSLRRERQLRGWSQAYLAEQIDVFDYYISRWERGEVLPSPYYQQKLCELFGKSAEELGFLAPSTAPHRYAAASPQGGSVDAEQSPPFGQREIAGLKGKNPFTYGKPISEPARFFGRHHEVEHIFSRLCNSEFESSSIVGDRRIGKTSLLKFVAHPQVRQSYGLATANYLFIYLDLQIIDEQTTPIRLWQWLLRQIAQACSDSDINHLLTELACSPAIDSFNLEEAFDAIDEKGMYIVLLLDEFEHVTENVNFDAAFFYGLRSLAIHHHLSLVTSSQRELIELCHSQVIRSSPFFNIFATITLGLLLGREALDLVTQLSAGTDVSFSEKDVQLLLRSAGRHPYFLQMACSLFFHLSLHGQADQDLHASFHKAFLEAAAPQLAFYWRSSDAHEKFVLFAAALSGELRHERNPKSARVEWQALAASFYPTLGRLEKRSLVVAAGKDWSLFGEVFEEWILREMSSVDISDVEYQGWLVEDKKASELLKGSSESARKNAEEVLARINVAYRHLLLSWLLEPKILSIIGGPVRAFIRSERRVSK